MANSKSIYPRTGDTQTVYLKNVITRPNIEVGDYTMYNDFVNDPKKFEQNEYSCAMKSHFRKSGNQMSGRQKSSYASLLA